MATKNAARTLSEMPLVIKGNIIEVTVEEQRKTNDIIPERKKSITNNNESQKNWGRELGKQSVKYMKHISKPTKDVKSKQVKNKSLISPVQQCRKKDFMNRNGHIKATTSKTESSQKKPDMHLKRPCEKSSSLNNVQRTVMVQDRAVQCKIPNSVDKVGECNLDLENIAVYSMLEKVGKFKEFNEMMTMSYEWSLERENLQSKIQDQIVALREINRKRASLEDQVKMLTQKLEEATRTIKTKEETISKLNNKLKQQIKNEETIEKIISDLRISLAEKTETERNMNIKNQCLAIKNEKLSALLSSKDMLINGYKNAGDKLIKEYQDTSKQLTSNESYVNEGNASSQLSVIQTGPICSSPNSSSSDIKNPIFFNEWSTSSLSINDHILPQKENTSRFVSLLEESSYTLMPDSYKDLDTAINGEETTERDYNKNNTVQCRSVNDHNKRNEIFKTKRLSKSKKRGYDTKTSFQHKNSLGISTNTAYKPVSNTEKIRQDIFNDVQNRIPVQIPSPLRKHPNPDWFGSSLSSVSTSSDLDIVPSNEV